MKVRDKLLIVHHLIHKPRNKPEAQFKAFHLANPRIYRELVRLARDLKLKGHQRYGISGLFEVIRWHRHMETTDPQFKLSNNHKPYYARLIMAREKDLNGFFQLNRLLRRKP